MDTYKKILKSYLMGEEPNYGDGGSHSLLEMLNRHYTEQNPMEDDAIRGEFDSLDGILSKLPLREHDAVWDLVCRLCGNHQRQGFLHGVRVGVRLASELASEE